MNLETFANKVWITAVKHGFWENDGAPLVSKKAEKIALMHSELSEALEAIRKPTLDKHCPEFTSEEVEFADCLIRILDYCYHYHLRLLEAAEAKAKFNETRPYKHGKTI